MAEWKEVLSVIRQDEIKNFIQENINSDVNQLLLNPPALIKPYSKEIANQILSRQKAKRKLDGWVSNPDLIFPPPLSIEQASSAETAHYKKSLISGKTLIDLTGGMGVDTLNLSENFEHTIYVEQNSLLVEIFSHNLRILHKSIDVIANDAETFLREYSANDASSTCIYLDPARRDESNKKVFNLEDCTPNLVELLPLIKEQCSTVLVKLSPFLDIHLILKRISNVKEVHVVSVKNECKELLALIDFNFQSEPIIKTVSIDTDNQVYDFKYSGEAATTSGFSTAKRYLFEPNASVLKAGAFNKIGKDFNLNKLHQNTHLYTSKKLISDWPGRTFEILANNVSKEILKEFAPNDYINVITRNYPKTIADIKKKFKIKDGGEFFLIGFIDCNQKNNLVVARKI